MASTRQPGGRGTADPGSFFLGRGWWQGIGKQEWLVFLGIAAFATALAQQGTVQDDLQTGIGSRAGTAVSTEGSISNDGGSGGMNTRGAISTGGTIAIPSTAATTASATRLGVVWQGIGIHASWHTETRLGKSSTNSHSARRTIDSFGFRR